MQLAQYVVRVSSRATHLTGAEMARIALYYLNCNSCHCRNQLHVWKTCNARNLKCKTINITFVGGAKEKKISKTCNYKIAAQPKHGFVSALRSLLLLFGLDVAVHFGLGHADYAGAKYLAEITGQRKKLYHFTVLLQPLSCLFHLIMVHSAYTTIAMQSFICNSEPTRHILGPEQILTISYFKCDHRAYFEYWVPGSEAIFSTLCYFLRPQTLFTTSTRDELILFFQLFFQPFPSSNMNYAFSDAIFFRRFSYFIAA